MKTLEKKTEPTMDRPMSSQFPTFYIDDKQMPEIVDWENGEEYLIKAKVRIQRKTTISDLDSETVDATIEMLSYELEK